jgi:glucokinase
MSEPCYIGIDVGGTKCAGGVVKLPEGRVIARRVQPTLPERGGEAVLLDVVGLCRTLQEEAKSQDRMPAAIGIGVAEMVDLHGRVVSEATIRWKEIDVKARVHDATRLATYVGADVRAAARAEAVLGAGRGLSTFLYVTVGTGISCSLVLDGVPYAGARGLTGTFASGCGLAVVEDEDEDLVRSMPLEVFASGPAISRKWADMRRGFKGTAVDVLALVDAGDAMAGCVVEAAGIVLGAAIAQLVNVLDPQAIIIGGGLGLVGGRYREAVAGGLRDYVWSDAHRDVPIISAELGTDAGWIGAALGAASPSNPK